MVRSLIPLLGTLILSGCLQPAVDSKYTGLVGDGGTPTAPITTPGLSGDVYLAVDSAWEMTDSNFMRQGECHVATGAAPTTNCTIRIPEGQLHFSKLKFTFGTTNPLLCQRVLFEPAYYVASKSATFKNNWTATPTAIDCSILNPVTGEPTNAGCYYGAATVIYSDFPTTVGNYFSTTFGLESSKTLDSANSKRIGSKNILACNKIDNPAIDIFDASANRIYVGGSMRSYTATCLDEWEQTQAKVNVYIADNDLSQSEDPGVPANDQYYDWGEVTR
ncbi:MAG: hypothetical protein H7301_10090 [Cryobacterium sp.]|nr:hypothetical protein [Oligoflexia bacterium]